MTVVTKPRTASGASIPALRREQAESSAQPCAWAGWPRSAVGGRAKRAFDIVGSVLAIIALSPILALLALLIRAHDKGPAVYRQERIGLGGRTFRCLKFRSMVVNGDAILATHLAAHPAAAREWALNQKLRDDPRITPIGRFLRKTSLDELPQLFNILRGDMSLVGPRPVVQDELEKYGLAKVHYLRARPGLTGLWQVSGRSHTSYRHRVEFDRTYVNRWSFLRDISILLKTLPSLLFRSGAM
jgi:exopolysaccharide production protein ExoY